MQIQQHSLFKANFPSELQKKPTKGLQKLFEPITNYVCNYLNSFVNKYFVKNAILPALTQFRRQYFNFDYFPYLSNIKVKTADGKAIIDGAIIWNRDSDKMSFNQGNFPLNQKWIISFNGNLMRYEDVIDEHKNYANDTDCNVVVFNYRGVSNSIGIPEKAEDLVLDGDAIYQYLLSKGVKSEDICINGLSLGGGISTKVRALHPEGPIVNIHSFSSIGKLFGASFETHYLNSFNFTYKRKIKDIKATYIKKKFAKLASKVISFVVHHVLKLASWEMDTLTTWKTLKCPKWIITAKNDEVMHSEGKLYTALKKEQPGYKKFSAHEKKEIKFLLGHGVEYATDKQLFLYKQYEKQVKIKESLNNIKHDGNHCTSVNSILDYNNYC